MISLLAIETQITRILSLPRMRSSQNGVPATFRKFSIDFEIPYSFKYPSARVTFASCFKFKEYKYFSTGDVLPKGV